MPNPNVVLDGNSLCVELYGVRSIADYIPRASAQAITLTNVALAGASTTQLIPVAAAKVDALKTVEGPNVLIFWEGSNDLYYGLTPEAAYANLRTYLIARRAAGWKVAVMSLLPRWNSETPATFEASRQYVNYMLRRYWLDYADALIDVGADHIMGETQTIWNAQWYQSFDHTHLAEGGSQRIGHLVAAGIQPLLRA